MTIICLVVNAIVNGVWAWLHLGVLFMELGDEDQSVMVEHVAGLLTHHEFVSLSVLMPVVLILQH